MFDHKSIEKILGIEFSKPELIRQAFIHRSYINEHSSSGLSHNERLEFLGDAVLELVVTDHLYRNFDNPEGELTSWRSALVKTESLAAQAQKLELGQYLQMSRGEAKNGGRERVALLANLFEAIIGAIYLDHGYEAAKNFVHEHIIAQLDQILSSRSYIDAKSQFQELAQERENTTPHYRVVSEEGPDHNKIFEVAVFLGAVEKGRGKGNSKQSAQQAAAADALKSYS
ncbi:ribonuclease III [bacterium]|nr:ribonuclease III [bacterium]